MSRELVTALNLDTCKGKLSTDGQFYDWPCRLSISVPSTARLAPDSYLHAKPGLWRAAHQRHHDTSHVIPRGQRRSFYSVSEPATGIPTDIASATCSCEVILDA